MINKILNSITPLEQTAKINEIIDDTNNAVHITVNERIEGQKLFAGAQDVTSDTSVPIIINQSNAINKGYITYGDIDFISDNTPIALIGGVHKPDGSGGIRLMGWNMARQAFDTLFWSTTDNPARYITETYYVNGSWYRLWSDGWCEQGGVSTTNTQYIYVTLLKPYSDANYAITGIADNYNEVAGSCVMVGENSQIPTGFVMIVNFLGAAPATQKIRWQTKGYVG